jgi:hypothetical protein
MRLEKNTRTTLEKLKIGDFVFQPIDNENAYRYGTIIETGIMNGYVKVCWVTTNAWPVSTREFYEDETRELYLQKLDTPEDVERLGI